MATFRKRVITIKAIQFKLGVTPNNAIFEFCPSVRILSYSDNLMDIGSMFVRTSTGFHSVLDEDWIIKDEDGRFSVMSDREFRNTYEQVE